MRRVHATRSLRRRLFAQSRLITFDLPPIRSRLDEIKGQRQEDSEATFAPVLKKADGLIDWSMKAASIECRVRGLQPWPNAYTNFRGEHFIIWKAEPLPGGKGVATGTVLEIMKDSLIVECGEESSLKLIEVQPQAKRRMTARDFLTGTHLHVGEIVG